MELKLADYSISKITGFALEKPLEKLPEKYQIWNVNAARMSHLVDTKTTATEVGKMGPLDWRGLKDHHERRLAHFQLGLIASAYVWEEGEQNARKILPKVVAVPFCQLTEDLGLKPIITYADIILANYRPKDPSKPMDLDNLKALYILPGNEEETEWFVVIHVAIELAFAKAFKYVLLAMEGGNNKDEGKVITSLKQLTEVVHEMYRIFERIKEKLSPDTFFNVMRPYASGWGGPGNPLPDGLIYEGVSDEPQSAVGGSAAQSGTIQVLDALLGVKHRADKMAFLLKMREYMVPGHKRFIEDVERGSEGLQTFVASSHGMIKAFNDLLSAIAAFRELHIKMVHKYIIAAASKRRKENKFESLDKKGTGGTNLVPFLQELRNDTNDRKILTEASLSGDHAE